jgi:hypothetical protein
VWHEQKREEYVEDDAVEVGEGLDADAILLLAEEAVQDPVRVHLALDVLAERPR